MHLSRIQIASLLSAGLIGAVILAGGLSFSTLLFFGYLNNSNVYLLAVVFIWTTIILVATVMCAGQTYKSALAWFSLRRRRISRGVIRRRSTFVETTAERPEK